MKSLGSCWVKGTKNGRCRGTVSRWILLVGGNWRTPIELWVCEGHEDAPFSTLVDLAEPVQEIKTSQPLGITPLRK